MGLLGLCLRRVATLRIACGARVNPGAGPAPVGSRQAPPSAVTLNVRNSNAGEKNASRDCQRLVRIYYEWETSMQLSLPSQFHHTVFGSSTCPIGGSSKIFNLNIEKLS